MDTSEEEEEAHKTTCTSYMRHNMWGTEKGRNCTVSTTRAASEQLLDSLWSFPCFLLSCCTGARDRGGEGWVGLAQLDHSPSHRGGEGWVGLAQLDHSPSHRGGEGVGLAQLDHSLPSHTDSPRVKSGYPVLHPSRILIWSYKSDYAIPEFDVKRWQIW